MCTNDTLLAKTMPLELNWLKRLSYDLLSVGGEFADLEPYEHVVLGVHVAGAHGRDDAQLGRGHGPRDGKSRWEASSGWGTHAGKNKR